MGAGLLRGRGLGGASEGAELLREVELPRGRGLTESVPMMGGASVRGRGYSVGVASVGGGLFCGGGA